MAGASAFIFISVVLSAAAQVSLKAGMSSRLSQEALSSGLDVPRALTILTQPTIGLGLLLYVASAGTWLAVLARMQVSSAYPFVALAIVLTSVSGWLIFGDTFSVGKIVGSVLIVIGVVTLAHHS